MNTQTVTYIPVRPVPTVIYITVAEQTAIDKVLWDSPHTVTPADTAMYRQAMRRAGSADNIRFVVK